MEKVVRLFLNKFDFWQEYLLPKRIINRLLFIREDNYMHNGVNNLNLELSLILARVYRSLKLKKSFTLDILEKDFSRDDMIFFPKLTLLAAQGPKGINKKIRTLAVLVQIMYLSTEIHSQITDGNINKNKFLNKVQLPILVGDFLYSKFYDILCAEECIDFLDDFIHYITELNLNWIDYLEGKSSLEAICMTWYGKLASMAMELAARSSGLNNYWIKAIKRYGFGIGNMYGAEKLKINSNNFRSMVHESLTLIPPSVIKETLSTQAYDLYEKMYSNTNNIQEKLKLSSVAES